MIKGAIILAAFATYVFVNGADISLYRIDLLDDKGYCVYGPDNPSINTIRYHASINPKAKGDLWTDGADDWDISAWFERRSDRTLIYKNTTASLNPGDTLHFQVEEYISDYVEISQPRDFVVPANAPRVSVTD